MSLENGNRPGNVTLMSSDRATAQRCQIDRHDAGRLSIFNGVGLRQTAFQTTCDGREYVLKRREWEVSSSFIVDAIYFVPMIILISIWFSIKPLLGIDPFDFLGVTILSNKNGRPGKVFGFIGGNGRKISFYGQNSLAFLIINQF